MEGMGMKGRRENAHCFSLNLKAAMEDTRRYGPLRAKKELIMLFWPIFGISCCPVVTLVTFSSNLREGYN